jgi:hypothetical protein
MDAILYRTRGMNDRVLREVARLAGEVPDKALWVVGCDPDMAEVVRGTVPRPHVIYTRRDILALPYAATLRDLTWPGMTGHHDLPVMAFFRERPEYDHYWIIEDDVRFAGDWARLFAALDASPADLLATTLYPRASLPDWYWWKSLTVPDGESVAETHLHKCFGPFARLSNRLLATLDRQYRRGLAGHFELIWPTLCHVSGFGMEDVGGHGPFVPPSRKGRFYTNEFRRWNLFPGTFVYRPAFRDDDIQQFGPDLAGRDMLWHPIK